MPTYVCYQCGKEFQRDSHRERKHGWCSRLCWREYANAHRRGIEISCANCGKKFFEYPSNLRQRKGNQRGRYCCSRECRYALIKGSGHYSWKGRYKNRAGYVLLRDALIPEEFKSMITCGHVLEHRLIMAQHLGRPLERHEVVHHLNGIKDDNRAENLELYPLYEHTGITNEHKLVLKLKKENTILKKTIQELEAKRG